MEHPFLDKNKLRELLISYENKEEMLGVAKKLVELGEKLYTPISLLNFDYKHYRYDHGDKCWIRSKSTIFSKIKAIDFLNLSAKKYKKIENPELDPYGEEDWGWEEIKEKFKSNSHIITKLYEFIELEKSYPYEFKYKIHLNKKWANDEDCYTYEFKDHDRITYNVGFFIDKNNEMSFMWADKEDYEKMMNDKISRFDSKRDPMKTNINYLYYILNTIFKIMFEFIEEHKEIKKITVGSYSKSKYKVYKQIIENRPEFKITRSFISDHGNGNVLYGISFKPRKENFIKKFFKK